MDSNLAELTENPHGLGGCRGSVLVVVGLIALVWSAWNGFADIHYAISAQPATAEVTYSWTVPHRYSATPYCYYQFTVDGKQYDGKDGDHQPGQKIPIVYMPDDPDESRSAETHAWLPLGPYLLVIGLAAIAYGAILLWKADDLLMD